MSEAGKAVDLSRVICVTNRRLVDEGTAQAGGEAVPGAGSAAETEDWTPFLYRLAQVVHARPRAVVLREKDLPPAAYERLAREVLPICHDAHVPCLLHTYADVAQRLGADGVHLPLALLAQMPAAERQCIRMLGASCHSVADVQAAERLGCRYVTLGHIYATACKPGLPPRGRELLRRACAAVRLPVYAIGGITPTRLEEIIADGAAGACVMSGLMRGTDWLDDMGHGEGVENDVQPEPGDYRKSLETRS